MYYCIVILQNRKVLVVPQTWVQHKQKKCTKVFLSDSGDDMKIPDFDLPVKYFIQKGDACYNGFLLSSSRYRKYTLTHTKRLIIRTRSLFSQIYFHFS